MADIRHRVGIAAPAERPYRALATTEGLSGLEGGPATPCPEDMKISSWG